CVPINPLCPVTKTFMPLPIQLKEEISHHPRRLPRSPQLFQIFPIPLRIQTSPESAMFEDRQLPILRQLHQRIALQHARFLGRQVWKEVAMEEEKSAVDPVVGKVRFFGKLLNPRPIDSQLAKSRRRIDAEHRSI